MKSNHEYQFMNIKYFSAMLCQNVVPKNKMGLWNLVKNFNDRNIGGIDLD